MNPWEARALAAANRVVEHDEGAVPEALLDALVLNWRTAAVAHIAERQQ